MTNYDILKEYEAHKTPVPSYDELQNMNEAVNQAIAANIKLVERAKQLEDLLKKCKEVFDECFSPSAKHGELYKKIDEALKW